jgi:hypothetical protein
MDVAGWTRKYPWPCALAFGIVLFAVFWFLNAVVFDVDNPYSSAFVLAFVIALLSGVVWSRTRP